MPFLALITSKKHPIPGYTMGAIMTKQNCITKLLHMWAYSFVFTISWKYCSTRNQYVSEWMLQNVILNQIC